MTQRAMQANVKVGIFVLVALAILVVGSLWVAGSPMLAGKRVPYRVVLNDSAGVKPGDRVRYAGVPVGRIEAITLRPREPLPVVFDILIRPDVPVTEVSEAKISTTGLLGTPFLEILIPEFDAPPLSPRWRDPRPRDHGARGGAGADRRDFRPRRRGHEQDRDDPGPGLRRAGGRSWRTSSG